MPKVGFECVAYRNTGTFATPVWNEIPNVRDATLPLDATEVDVTTRGSGGFEAVIAGLIKTGLEFKMVWDPADADFTAIQTAFFNRTAIEFLFLDDAVDVPGAQGLRAYCAVLSFPRAEPLDGSVEVDVKVKPTYRTDPAEKPSWYTVPGT